MAEPLKWYDEKADNSPWIKALAEVRHRATREGWCYQHVQAITVPKTGRPPGAGLARMVFLELFSAHRRMSSSSAQWTRVSAIKNVRL